MDLVIDKRTGVQVKSVEALSDVHLTQVLICLKLANHRIDLLINFNVLRLKDGIKRTVKRVLTMVYSPRNSVPSVVKNYE